MRVLFYRVNPLLHALNILPHSVHSVYPLPYLLDQPQPPWH
jgi:hypothetical protein